MSFTSLLEAETYGKSTFSSSRIASVTGTFQHDISTIERVRNDTKNAGSNVIGDVLAVSNAFYYLSSDKEPRDIILPSSPQPGDFVAVIYDHIDTIELVSKEAGWFPKFRIKSYKHKIMDLFENMYVDVPFHRLQLTFFDESKGWLLS